MSHAARKAAIDCTGYRKEMDNEVDLIVCGVEDRKKAINEFIELQQEQEKMWLAWRDEWHDF